nr:DUF5677 domain-containing protein [uncultured Methanoregula sp.]
MYQDYIKEIKSEELVCKKRTGEKFKKELNFFNALSRFYANQLLATRINKESCFSTQELVIFTLNARIIKSSLCANNLLKNGYYNESIVIQRSIYESIHVCKFLMKHPELSENWLKNEQFTPSKVAKDLKTSPIMKKIYDTFCDFTHPNFSSIFDLITIEKRSFIYDDLIERDTSIIHTCAVFNENLALGSISYQILFMLMGLDDFFEFFMKNYTSNEIVSYQKRRQQLQNKFDKICVARKKI